jgi:hypothetical protein
MWQDVVAAFLSRLPLLASQRQSPYMLAMEDNPLGIAASGTASSRMQIQGDCDVQFDQWVAWSSDSSWPTTLGFRVDIAWGAREWKLSNTPIRGELVFGTAQRPGSIGYRPWRIDGRKGAGQSTLVFTFTNLNTATLTVEPCLKGHRVMSS